MKAKDAKKSPKKKSSNAFRLIAYGVIMGGLTLNSVVLFGISQALKNQYKASKENIEITRIKVDDDKMMYPEFFKEVSETEQARSDDTIYRLDTSYKGTDGYKDVEKHLNKYNAAVSTKVGYRVGHIVVAIPAYGFSMAALISVGLILNHSEKVKEREEKEV